MPRTAVVTVAMEEGAAPAKAATATAVGRLDMLAMEAAGVAEVATMGQMAPAVRAVRLDTAVMGE